MDLRPLGHHKNEWQNFRGRSWGRLAYEFVGCEGMLRIRAATCHLPGNKCLRLSLSVRPTDGIG